MNGYKPRSSYEQHYKNLSESPSMATVYETSPTTDLPYHASGQYNIPQPYNSYIPTYIGTETSPMSFEPHNLHAIPHSRHDSNVNQHHSHYRQAGEYTGYPVDSQSPRYGSILNLQNAHIESQETAYSATMSSEPINPPLEGFPQVEEFDELMESYVKQLSIKKQDKALINSQKARDIRSVLIDPKNTSVGSAQFRFWVKKMFKLWPNDARASSKQWICHEEKPVAIREKLFKILTRAHQQCQHGGRDKTSAQVRQIYSWVPKELISRFVKICPTCQIRRGGTHLSPSDSGRGSPPPELGRIQSSQAAYPYMPGQTVADFEDDRRNSTSSSYDYPESRNRQWDGYNSPNSHSVNSTWSTSPSNYQYQPRQQQHHHQYHNNHHHHHHGNRHHLQINPHADPGSGHSTHRNNSANSKLMSPQMDTMSSVSSSSRPENSPVQLQYMSGYSTSHPNSRYRSGC